jgi:hypothetical protein
MEIFLDFIIKYSGEFITGFAVLFLLILDFIRRKWKSKLDISGEWQGLSLYIPLQDDPDIECIYKIQAKFKQVGPYLKLEEELFEIQDVNENVMEREKRKVYGKGKFYGDKDIIINLQEDQGLTCGVMYLISNSWGKELSGYIVVTNPFDGTPVVVKIMLRKDLDKPVKLKDLRFHNLQFIHQHFFKKALSNDNKN